MCTGIQKTVKVLEETAVKTFSGPQNDEIRAACRNVIFDPSQVDFSNDAIVVSAVKKRTIEGTWLTDLATSLAKKCRGSSENATTPQTIWCAILCNIIRENPRLAKLMLSPAIYIVYIPILSPMRGLDTEDPIQAEGDAGDSDADSITAVAATGSKRKKTAAQQSSYTRANSTTAPGPAYKKGKVDINSVVKQEQETQRRQLDLAAIEGTPQSSF
ncbi:hypothetical protein B0H14DRAFT_2652940 [Mycena olivaceomarginata]|nr:hypothetical protein B0H14DRAFT_2652940 [Mycena olivaceomarginata]